MNLSYYDYIVLINQPHLNMLPRTERETDHPMLIHYSDVIMSEIASLLFAQPYVQAQIK